MPDEASGYGIAPSGHARKTEIINGMLARSRSRSIVALPPPHAVDYRNRVLDRRHLPSLIHLRNEVRKERTAMNNSLPSRSSRVRKNSARRGFYRPWLEQFEDRTAPGSILHFLVWDAMFADPTEPILGDGPSAIAIRASVPVIGMPFTAPTVENAIGAVASGLTTPPILGMHSIANVFTPSRANGNLLGDKMLASHREEDAFGWLVGVLTAQSASMSGDFKKEPIGTCGRESDRGSTVAGEEMSWFSLIWKNRPFELASKG